ncbi:type II R-M system restriction endonuclease [Flectobacillus major]|uniref:type II R-M system restriction endonuclease n=1 Tax=Flectobacillus major TaxID=103 RepID=UPI0003F7211A|nr:type II R-M system restriction endonuclease [Flectobacillus major]
MNNTQLLGSQTAKNGFRNEDDIINKFNCWEADEDAQKWLTIMQYNLAEIDNVKAIKLRGYKTDVQIQISIKLKEVIGVENLQVKLVSSQKGFNQVDKRWVNKYAEMWQMPDEIITIFKKYTGEIPPSITNPKNNRRMFFHEFTAAEQAITYSWLKQNKTLIVSDILRGQGRFAAEWMLVAQKTSTHSRWVLKPMNFCLNFFGNDDISITERGNFKIGKITMQRKGGDAGRDSAKMLQFKIDPTELFKTVHT